MNKTILATLLSLFFILPGAFAQMERTVYQSFELDSATVLSLKLVENSFEAVPWAGNTILVETNIKISNASPAILDYFIKNGRYELKFERNVDAGNLEHKELARKQIKSRVPGQDVVEEIKVKVFVPENFEVSKENNLIFNKKKETDEPQNR